MNAFFGILGVLVTVVIFQISAKPAPYSLCPQFDNFFGHINHHRGCCIDENTCMYDVASDPRAVRQVENFPVDTDDELFQRKRRFVGSGEGLSYMHKSQYYSLCRSNVTVIKPIFATSAKNDQIRVQLLQVPPLMTQSIVVHTCEEAETPIVRGYCKQHYKWESVYTVKENPNSTDNEVIFQRDWILVGAGCDLTLALSLENSDAPYVYNQDDGQPQVNDETSKFTFAHTLEKDDTLTQSYTVPSTTATTTIFTPVETSTVSPYETTTTIIPYSSTESPVTNPHETSTNPSTETPIISPYETTTANPYSSSEIPVVNPNTEITSAIPYLPAPSTSHPTDIYSSNLIDFRGQQFENEQHENSANSGYDFGQISGRSAGSDDDGSIPGERAYTAARPQGSSGDHLSGGTPFASPYRRMYQLPDKIGVPVYSLRDNPDRIRSLMTRS